MLILSCGTGGGHNSAAAAVQEELLRRGHGVTLLNPLDLSGGKLAERVDHAYIDLAQAAPGGFGAIYAIGNAYRRLPWRSPVYFANGHAADALADYLRQHPVDVIVMTHLFPAEMLTYLKNHGVTIPKTLFITTDYTCIPFLPETELDRYVIAHEDLVEEFVEKGIPREKIVPLGIPVDEERYGTRLDRNAARALVCDEFAWEPSSEESRWFLIMGGSMGFGNMGGLISTLLRRIQPEDRVICICGRNEVQKTSLLEEFGYDGRFLATGFTDRVPELMDASDVLFSKPGGITGTEAVLKNIPLVHTSPIPGLETYNARFFHYHNMSYSTSDPLMQAEVALRLCNDASWRERMVQAQKRNSNSRCCRDITELVLTLTRK